MGDLYEPIEPVGDLPPPPPPPNNDEADKKKSIKSLLIGKKQKKQSFEEVETKQADTDKSTLQDKGKKGVESEQNGGKKKIMTDRGKACLGLSVVVFLVSLGAIGAGAIGTALKW